MVRPERLAIDPLRGFRYLCLLGVLQGQQVTNAPNRTRLWSLNQKS